MDLYLVQHAEAKKEDEDPARPLSDKGVADITRVAQAALPLLHGIDTVFHSGKLRARQTAEILARHVEPAGGIRETDGLAPLDDPALWAERLKGMDRPVILVGHMPHLEKLSLSLLTAEKDRAMATFTMGGMLCLRRDDEGTWTVGWRVTPGEV
jgi:phosphohistidine phosphatase